MNVLCECGCGQPTGMYGATVKSKGYIKGAPRRFLPAHHLHLWQTQNNLSERRRGRLNPNWKGDPSLKATHSFLRRNFPKTGICEGCGSEALRTDYAFLHHPAPYTRDRSDYRELCRPCHAKLDRPRATHCVRSHEFTIANTYIDPRGRRYCRECNSLRHRAARMTPIREPADAEAFLLDALKADGYPVTPTRKVVA